MKAGQIRTVAVDALELAMEPGPCAYSVRNRSAIDAFFAHRKLTTPALWNGPVVVLSSCEFVTCEGNRTRLVGRFVETDYATLLWLLHGDEAAPCVRNCFAVAALRGSDGAFVLTRQAEWTLNAGRIYVAAGTPDPSDVADDGTVDLEAGMLRELHEETGLTAARFTWSERWLALYDDRRLALIRELVAPETSSTLAARIDAFVGGQARPEIDEAVIARGPDDLDVGMPDFVRHYLRTAWGQPAEVA